MRLLKVQESIAKENFDTAIFVEGVAGTGKTTAAIERVKQLLRDGVRPDSILVFVPQAALAVPYQEALQRSRIDTSIDIHTMTLGKLAQQMVSLFFPLVAQDIGFAHPEEEPHFLSLELVQYYMTRFVEPVVEERDYFNSVHITRNRLYTQIVDNLNKSSLMDFPIGTLADRLKTAWRGDIAQQYIYEDAQTTAELFREQCKEYNLLDFSLQVEIFVKHLWQKPQVKQHLFGQYKHLIVDNIEEDNPTTHQLIRDWLPHFESSVLLYDSQGGFRRFLGADPKTAYDLKSLCDVHVSLDNHRVMSSDIEAFQYQMAVSLDYVKDIALPKSGEAREAIIYEDNRFHTDMIDWVVEYVASLIHQEGVSPSEIVILAPYVSDALRFSLQTRFKELGVPNRTHRPSRALRDEPASRALLTFAKIAHPQWNLQASAYDVGNALMAIITDLDLVRARLLTEMLYKKDMLQPFTQVTNDKARERITFDFGMRYDGIVQWLDAYRTSGETLPIDMFFSKFFGEVLSQTHYKFHNDVDAANITANLIDSAREFRQTVQRIEPELDTSLEYVRMVDRGVIANQYIREWDTDKRQDAVLIAPAYTFLLSNLPVDYQFWLSVGSNGWSQRLYQPLTHPYVLSQQWQYGDVWTDTDEVKAEQETLANLILGLIRRCRKTIYLGMSEFGEQGYEQRGVLIMAIQSMLRRLQKDDGHV